MRALTVQQPWAWAIARGWKPVENRSWVTHYRGPLVIHAATRWDADVVEALRFVRDQARAQGATLPATLAEDDPYTNLGRIVAVADLVDICTAAARGGMCDCGPWARPGQAHWKLALPRLCHVPDVCGQRGLWVLNPATAHEVTQQVEEAA